MPERFEVFYLREYPKVVELLHGLLGSRLVAEELAQETFLVAYRDWDRISRLDNPRAWVRKVAINQRGSFLRAYLRQQTREGHAVVQYEDDRIKLADDHAEVWQAIRTLPPLQAQAIALHYYEDYSVAQVAAALGRAPGTIKAQLHHGCRKLARLLATDAMSMRPAGCGRSSGTPAGRWPIAAPRFSPTSHGRPRSSSRHPWFHRRHRAPGLSDWPWSSTCCWSRASVSCSALPPATCWTPTAPLPPRRPAPLPAPGRVRPMPSPSGNTTRPDKRPASSHPMVHRCQACPVRRRCDHADFVRHAASARVC
jgi:RNA polymerase sigma-70 factor (ECF subfamily)